MPFNKRSAIIQKDYRELLEEWTCKSPLFCLIENPFGFPMRQKAFQDKRGERMSKRETYEERTQQLLIPIAEKNHVEIYDIEYVKEGNEWYLRAFIDKEGGVNINDCETVSRALSDELDRTDFIEDAYILEVSSPGLGRTLKKDKHLQKSLMEEIEIRTYKPISGSKEFNGILKAFDDHTITILSGEEEMVFQRNDIAVVKLALNLN